MGFQVNETFAEPTNFVRNYPKRLRCHYSTVESASCNENNNLNNKDTENDRKNNNNVFNVTNLPLEILWKILSYLPCQDLNSLKLVSTFFERVIRDPMVWRVYEVTNNGMPTSEVLSELKAMPRLKKISIDARADCDEILRQVSVTNKHLEELYISNCTGSTSQLYLRSIYLIRILERCKRLHTISISGTRFRGVKFYKLLGDMGLRLKAVSASATRSQFRTFVKYAKHIAEEDRFAIGMMCFGSKKWGPLHYFVIERPKTNSSGHLQTAIVSYFYHDFLTVQMSQTSNQSTSVK